MERLICSSSAAFSKPHLNSSHPDAIRLGHLESQKFGFLIPTTMTYSKCSLIKPFTMRCIRPQICCFSKVNDEPVHFESSIDQSTNGLSPGLQSGEVRTAGSRSEKVFMTRKKNHYTVINTCHNDDPHPSIYLNKLKPESLPTETVVGKVRTARRKKNGDVQSIPSSTTSWSSSKLHPISFSFVAVNNS